MDSDIAKAQPLCGADENTLMCMADHQPKGDDKIADVTNKPLWGSQRAAAEYHFQSGPFKASVAFAFF